MKFRIACFLLLVALVDLVSADWVGHVVNKCDFDVWAKTTRQPGSDGNAILDSPMEKISAGGGIYNAAFIPVYGNGEGSPDASDHAHGVTIKLQKEEDPSFATGHVYQLEYTPYWYQDPNVQWLSADLSVVDGNPFTDIVRYAEILVDGKRLDASLCNSSDGGTGSVLYCAPSDQPCPAEWQPGHARSENDPEANYTSELTCQPMNNNPQCSHPIECRAGPTGVFQFTLCG
ncbi:uncharacterized protein BKCO1_5400040 [Diplodia corticola]|uniref:BYS1 domain protein n=1 Tax=Diplodia corticola TaxID=236234 RepID=A0A1J9RR74_9PEZI|nr:uncharacterized protein BKCO1_5400040 [Diplodia corticola]OJD30927.1 hypothetical protein BKCO1_5400040 [Diplodia corticola]